MHTLNLFLSATATATTIVDVTNIAAPNQNSDVSGARPPAKLAAFQTRPFEAATEKVNFNALLIINNHFIQMHILQ